MGSLRTAACTFVVSVLVGSYAVSYLMSRMTTETNSAVAHQHWRAGAKQPGRTLLLETVDTDQESSDNYTHSAAVDAIFPLVLRDLDSCLRSSNLLKRDGIEAIAKSNALDFYKLLRLAIPREFSSGYASPCWDSYFSAVERSRMIRGTFQDADGTRNHTSTITRIHFGARHAIRYHGGHLESKLLCLPRVFLAGYPKCGSTFTWCFMNKLLIAQGVNIRTPASDKEPHWWVDTHPTVNSCHTPVIGDLSKYFLYFVPGLEDIESQGNKNELLIDGTPNMMFSWQRFCSDRRQDLANYCLLPSLLPRLIPSARFIVVMRNPVDVLYSAFWFSCTFIKATVSRPVQLQGPDIFHKRIWQKINHFTRCMTEESGALSKPCTVDTNFGICIKPRLHLLDKCVHEITYNIYTGNLNKCGRSRLEMVLYYVHTRKWLSTVPAHKFLFLKLEELTSDPAKVAKSIQGFLGIPEQAVDMQKITSSCRQNTQKTIDYHNDPHLQMRNDTRMLIQTFYKPFNEMLAELLDDPKFLWQS